MESLSFSHQINPFLFHSPRGPPLGEWSKGRNSKMSFCEKQSGSRASTDIFKVFPRYTNVAIIPQRNEMPLAKREKTEQITVKLPKS